VDRTVDPAGILEEIGRTVDLAAILEEIGRTVDLAAILEEIGRTVDLAGILVGSGKVGVLQVRLRIASIKEMDSGDSIPRTTPVGRARTVRVGCRIVETTGRTT
jgi:hypothetical protein